MASEEEVFNLSARREVLRSFSLSDTETSVEHNLWCAHAHHNSLMHQWVAAEDAPEMAWVLNAEHESVEQIIEEEQAHRAQVATLTEMQLPSYAKGGATGERMEEAKCSFSWASGGIKIFSWKASTRISSTFATNRTRPA